MLFVAGGRPGDGTVDFAYLFDGGRYLVTQAGDFGFDVGDELVSSLGAGEEPDVVFELRGFLLQLADAPASFSRSGGAGPRRKP